MFDVEAGDVVRQEEHFVAPEFGTVFCCQFERLKFAHQPNDEVPGAHKGIDDVNAFIGEGTVKFGFEEIVYALHHEIDNRLRRIDDAVRIRNIGGIPLKKLFIDSIQEVLFLREIDESCRLAFDGAVKPVQVLEECVAAKRLGGERVNDVLNFACDDIAAGEIRVREDGAEGAFCQQVLDKHFLHGRLGELWVDGGLTELMEIGECGSEARVRFVLRPDECFYLAFQCGDFGFELGDGSVPLGGVFTFVGEERLQHRDERFRGGDVCV